MPHYELLKTGIFQNLPSSFVIFNKSLWYPTQSLPSSEQREGTGKLQFLVGWFFIFHFWWLFKKFIFGWAGSSLLWRLFLSCSEWELFPSCCVQASHFSRFSLRTMGLRVGEWASVIAVPGLDSTGSIVVAHGLSCSEACGIFLDQGSNPRLLHWQVDSFFFFPFLNYESMRTCLQETWKT